MKKLIASVLALICVFATTGCNNKLDGKPTVIGNIQEIHEDYILIATSTTEGHPYGASVDIVISIKSCDAIYTPMTVGDEIVVYYDGNMSGQNPAQVDTVYAITLKTPST